MHGRYAMLLAVLLVAAGCISLPQGEELTPTADPPPSPAEPEAEDGTEQASDASGDGKATGREGNRTGEPDPARRGDGAGGNATGPNTTSPSEVDGEPERYDPGWPPMDEAPLRPGSSMYGQLAEQFPGPIYNCTLSFVFGSPDNRTLYISTAGHCVCPFEPGDTVPLLGGRVNATLAYSSLDTMAEVNGTAKGPQCEGTNTSGEPVRINDLALLAIPDEARELVHPAVRRFGGPTGLAGSLQYGDRVLSYGNSIYRADLDPLKPREGYVVSSDRWQTFSNFVPETLGGDSGSGVMTADGRAQGTISKWAGPRVHVDATPAACGPLCTGSSNLAPALDYAERYGGVEVELATWPLLEEPTLPPYPG